MSSKKKTKRPRRIDLVAAIEARFRSNPVSASLLALAGFVVVLGSVAGAIKEIRDLIPARGKAAPTNVALPLRERARSSGARVEPDSPRGAGREVAPQGDAAATGLDSVLRRLEPRAASGVRRVLELGLRARFRTARFNVRDYLRSVQDVRRDTDPGQPTVFPWDSDSRFAVDSIEPAGLWGRLVVGWPAESTPGRWLPVRLGPYRDSVDLGKLEWAEHAGRADSSGGRWWLARGTVEVSLPDPSWPMLLSSRLLRTTAASRSVLEITFHNASDAPAAVNEIALHGRLGPSISCFFGGRTQVVEVDWRRLRSTQGTDGAWTMIGGDTVLVRARFEHGACSNRMSLTLPTSITVDAHGIQRFTFEMVERETPASSSPGTRHLEARGPESMSLWDDLAVTVGPRGQFFPALVMVDR